MEGANSEQDGSPLTDLASSTSIPQPLPQPEQLQSDDGSGAHFPVTAVRSLSTSTAVRRREYIKINEDTKRAAQQPTPVSSAGRIPAAMKRVRSVRLECMQCAGVTAYLRSCIQAIPA